MARGRHLWQGEMRWLAAATLVWGLYLGLCLPQTARAQALDVPEETAAADAVATVAESADEAAPAQEALVPTACAEELPEAAAEPDPSDAAPLEVIAEAEPDDATTAAEPADVPVPDAPVSSDEPTTTPAPTADPAGTPAPEQLATAEEDETPHGWVEEDGVRRYYDADGTLHTGWLECDEGVFYLEEDGTPLKGLHTFDRSNGSGQDLLYFHEETGALQSGWLTYEGKRLHFNEKTAAADKGWKTIEGKRYHFASNYAADTGVVKIGGKRYAFASDGALMTGKAGLRTIGGEKYYVKADGTILTGFKVIKGKRYAFVAAQNGAMAKSCLIKNYLVAWNGVCYKIPAKKGGKEASAQRVAKLIAKCVTPKSKIKGSKDLTRVREAAAFVAAFASRAKYTMKGTDYRTAYGVFYAKRYSCAGTTRALGAVLTQMKIKWKHENANKYTHQWCKVKMDGKWGWADSDIEVMDIDWETGKVRGSVVTGQANYGRRF